MQRIDASFSHTQLFDEVIYLRFSIMYEFSRGRTWVDLSRILFYEVNRNLKMHSLLHIQPSYVEGCPRACPTTSVIINHISHIMKEVNIMYILEAT